MFELIDTYFSEVLYNLNFSSFQIKLNSMQVFYIIYKLLILGLHLCPDKKSFTYYLFFNCLHFIFNKLSLLVSDTICSHFYGGLHVHVR